MRAEFLTSLLFALSLREELAIEMLDLRKVIWNEASSRLTAPEANRPGLISTDGRALPLALFCLG